MRAERAKRKLKKLKGDLKSAEKSLDDAAEVQHGWAEQVEKLCS